jgi:thymidine kinase
MNKLVIVAGLDSDYMRKPFPEMMKLTPLAESITKLLSVCSECSNDGAFSFRKDHNLKD